VLFLFFGQRGSDGPGVASHFFGSQRHRHLQPAGGLRRRPCWPLQRRLERPGSGQLPGGGLRSQRLGPHVVRWRPWRARLVADGGGLEKDCDRPISSWTSGSSDQHRRRLTCGDVAAARRECSPVVTHDAVLHSSVRGTVTGHRDGNGNAALARPTVKVSTRHGWTRTPARPGPRWRSRSQVAGHQPRGVVRHHDFFGAGARVAATTSR
jgi:hypothetical protein